MTLTAERARSILACPHEIELTIDGVPCELEGEIAGGPVDNGGVPLFLCRPGGRLSRASRAQRAVEVSMTSKLGGHETLTLTGTLRWLRTQSCACCSGVRDQIVLDVAEVFLGSGEDRVAVEISRFSHPSLQFNPGAIRRSQEHVNSSHSEELRHAVAQRKSVAIDDILAAQIVDLTRTGVELQWVTIQGAHRERLVFPAPATGGAELSAMLRAALKVGIC